MATSFLRRPLVLGGLLILAVGGGIILLLNEYSRSQTTTPGRDTASFTVQAVPAHIQELKAADPAVRQKAAMALWQIGAGARDAVPALLEATRDPAPEVRTAAAKALGHASEGTTAAVLALVEALKDKQADVRAEAAASLAQLFVAEQQPPVGGRGRRELEQEERRREGRGRGKARAEEEEREEQDREHKQRSPRAEDLLIKLKPEGAAAAPVAVPPLVKLLQDPEARVRARAAAALAEIGALGRSAVPSLIHILQDDSDNDARLQASIALGRVGPDAREAVPVLAKRLRNDEYATRANCAAALAHICANPEVAVPPLVDAYLKDIGDVHNWAMIALNMYGEPAARLAVPLLREAISDPRNELNKTIQRRARRALEISEGKLDEKEATPPAESASKK
jgi:hypothetical protein